MKRHFFRFLVVTVVAVSAAVVTSCGDDEKSAPKLTVSSTSEEFEAIPNGTKSVAVTSNIAWSVAVQYQEGASGWLTVSPMNGNGDGELELTAQVNSGAEREATITVSGEGVEAKIVTVAQKAGSGSAGSLATGYDKGFIQIWGVRGQHFFYLNLYSGDLDFENGTGTGNMLSLELWSSADNDLESGAYTYSSSPQPFRYTYAGVAINYNLSTESGTAYEITDGSVTISKSGNIYTVYTVTYNLTTNDGRKVEGTYTGVLEIIDDTSPTAVTGLTAVQSGSTVILSWNTVIGASWWRFYRSDSPNGSGSLIAWTESDECISCTCHCLIS